MKNIFRIALRYFFSAKKKNLINWIGIFSICAVMFGTMGLIIVLSAFNGLDELVKNIFRTFDAELRISTVKGKTFEVDEEFLRKIKTIEGVGIISEIIEDDAVMKYKENAYIIRFKGVSQDYFEQNKLEHSIVQGRSKLISQDSMFYCLMGQGVRQFLSAQIDDQFNPLVMWYVRNEKNPQRATVSRALKLAGVFSIEKQFDEHFVFIPLELAKELTSFSNRRTSLELNTKEGYDTEGVKQKIKQVLGDDFLVQNSDEQHANLYKAHQVEKLITFIIFAFILFIGSLTIFFTLSIQVMEKTKDVAVLLCLGLKRSGVRAIFLLNGLFISLTGTLLGLFFSVLLLRMQQKFGLLSMNMETSIVESYPVKMIASDFVLTGITMVVVTLVISYYPALQASKIKTTEHL